MASFDDARFFTGIKHNGGMGDTQVIFAHNFYGAPALPQEEFATWTPGTFFSGVLWVIAPTGDYDKDKVINIDANCLGGQTAARLRYTVRPDLAGDQRQRAPVRRPRKPYSKPTPDLHNL